MSKNRGQTRNRSVKRGNTDARGVSLKRPFNNSKRTRGRLFQVRAEKYYRYLVKRLKEIRKEQNEALIEEQLAKLNEGKSIN